MSNVDLEALKRHLETEIKKLQEKIRLIEELEGLNNELHKSAESSVYKKMGLTDACRDIFAKTNESLRATEVNIRLSMRGKERAGTKEYLPSVYATLERMVENGELQKLREGDFVKYKKEPPKEPTLI